MYWIINFSYSGVQSLATLPTPGLPPEQEIYCSFATSGSPTPPATYTRVRRRRQLSVQHQLLDAGHADRYVLQSLELAALDALNERRTQAFRHVEIPCLNGGSPRCRFDDDSEPDTIQVWSATPVIV